MGMAPSSLTRRLLPASMRAAPQIGAHSTKLPKIPSVVLRADASDPQAGLDRSFHIRIESCGSRAESRGGSSSRRS